MELKKLPRKYEVAEHLFSVATRVDSAKMLDEINNFAKLLIDLWCKSFGQGHNISLTAVKNRMKNLAREYYKEVYVKAHQKNKKHNDDCMCTACTSNKTSKRNLERKWKAKSSELFDIGCKMDELECSEKEFYEDQNNKRIGCLDDEIDEQYDQEQENLRQAMQVEFQRHKEEEDFIMQPLENEQADEDTMNSTSNDTLNLTLSVNR